MPNLTQDDVMWRPPIVGGLMAWDELLALDQRLNDIAGVTERSRQRFQRLVAHDRAAKDLLDDYESHNYDEALRVYADAIHARFALAPRPREFRATADWVKRMVLPSARRKRRFIIDCWYFAHAVEFSAWMSHLLTLANGDRPGVIQGVRRLCPVRDVPGFTDSSFEHAFDEGGAALGAIERWLRIRSRHRDGRDLVTAIAMHQSYFTDDELPRSAVALLQTGYPLYAASTE